MVYLLIGTLCLCAGAAFCYLAIKPKLNNIETLNERIQSENAEIEYTNRKLKESTIALQESASVLKTEYDNLNKDCSNLKQRRQELTEDLKNTENNINSITDTMYNQSYQLMQEKLSEAAEKLSKDYQQFQEDIDKQKEKVIRENGEEIAEEIQLKTEQLQQILKEIEDNRAKFASIIEAAKREEDKKLEQDKYKINLSAQDLEEIKRLREIIPYFRDSRAISKIIWESYYRNNTNDLISRILGNKTHTGIYKITNTINQKVYVGQARNISDRLKEHIKAGLGIDTPNNKLYKAMLADGVENFSFELLEDCEINNLNNREIYWIDFYHAQDFGYNMTKGGSRS